MERETIWSALRRIEGIVRRLPHQAAVEFGAVIGRTVHLCDKRRVDAAEARCVHVLGVGVTTARRVVRGSYANLGRSGAEFLRLPVMKDALLRYVRIFGECNLRAALAEGKGVILLTAHFGSWETAAAALALRGFPMNAIGAEQRDERVTDLVASLRASCGVRTIGKGFDLKEAIRCLRRGEILGVLLDQDAREAGVVAPFLGLPASTPYGPVKLAFRLGARVVPLFIVRRGGAFHDLHLLPAIEEEHGRPFGEDTESAVTRCNALLGDWIARFPEQWMWLYPRWATTTDLPR